MRNRKKDRQDIKEEALREKNRRLREALKALKEERREQYIPVGSRVADGYGIDWSSHAGEKRKPATEEKSVGLLRSVLNSLYLMALLLVAAGVVYTIVEIYSDRHEQALIEKGKVFVSAYYPDMTAAVRRNAVEEGWVPLFTPEGATDIRDKHDKATQEGWLSFRFSIEQGRKMEERILKMQPDRIGGLTIKGPGEKWWPDRLTGTMKNYRPSTATWEFYRTSRWARQSPMYEYMAIDWKKCEAYLWRELI